MIPLTNNRLILNWHRIFSVKELKSYLEKKFRVSLNDIFEIRPLLEQYPNLRIAIRHSDTFLKDEELEERNSIISFFECCWDVKLTWKH